MSLNESQWVSISIIRLGSYGHLPRVQETSPVSYYIPVSYCMSVSYCIPASAYGLKAISDWFAKKLTRKRAKLNHVQVLCSQVKSHGPLILPHGNVTITLKFIGSFLEFIGSMAFADYATNFQGTLYLHAWNGHFNSDRVDTSLPTCHFYCIAFLVGLKPWEHSNCGYMHVTDLKRETRNQYVHLLVKHMYYEW